MCTTHNTHLRLQLVLAVVFLCSLQLLPVPVLSQICIYGDIRFAKIRLEGQDLNFRNETKICCQQGGCHTGTERYNGAITHVENSGKLVVGHFDSVSSTYTGPIVDVDDVRDKIDWDRQRRSFAQSITNYFDSNYCVHGVFYLQRRHEPYKSLFYDQNRGLSVPDEKHARGCSETTIASLYFSETKTAVYIEEPAATDDPIPIVVSVAQVNSTTSTKVSLTDDNERQVYYGGVERPQKLVLGTMSLLGMQSVCVITNVQQLICGIFRFETQTWTHQSSAGGSNTRNTNYLAHNSVPSVTVEAGLNFVSIINRNCDSSECNARFETIEGEVHFVSLATLHAKDYFGLSITTTILVSITSLAILALSLSARKQDTVRKGLIVVTVSMLLIYNIITVLIGKFSPIPSIILLLCIMVLHSISQPLVWRDRTLVAAMFAAVCSASVPMLFDAVDNVDIEIRQSFVAISVCFMIADLAVVAALIRYIRNQPKTTRKPLIGLVIFISVVTVICIPAIALSHELSPDLTIAIGTSLLVLISWTIAAIWVRVAAKRLSIPSKLLHVIFVYSAMRWVQPVISAMYCVNMLTNRNQLEYLMRSTLTTASQVVVVASSLVLTLVAGIGVAQYVRVWFAKRNVRNQLKQLKQDRSRKLAKNSRKGTDSNAVSTLRERLLDDLDADRSRGGSSSGAAGSESNSTSELERYNDSLDVLYQLAERCFIPIHHLKFHRRIAQGSFGVVYEALWQTTGTTVAVKILKNYNEEAKIEFLREASILSELRHPNIVMFLGVSLKEESFCIVTEFATKGSLQDVLLCESLIAWNTKIRLCMEIVKALGYLHGCTPMILHRDLKSRNILLDGNMSVKLCDFGLAKHEQGTTHTANIGTVHFMAPEIITGGKYSTKCDIYSFAIVMWEIFYQREPYSNDEETGIGNEDGNGSSSGGANQFTLPLRVVQGLRPTEYANQRQIVWEGSESEVEAEVKEKYLYIMRRCWSAEPDERPDITWILTELQSLLV